MKEKSRASSRKIIRDEVAQRAANDTACVGYQASDQRQKCCSFTKKKSWERVFDRVSFTILSRFTGYVLCFCFLFCTLEPFFCSCPGRFALQSAATTRKGQFPFVKSNKKHSRSLAKQWNALVLFCVFACTSHAVSPSPGFVKLLALSNISAFVHFDPCFTGLYGQCCFLLSDAECHRCFLLLNWMRLFVTGISNPMVLLLSFVHHWWLDSGMALSSLTHSRRTNLFSNLFD